MAGFDAGSVFVKLGFQPEFSGADQYERRADAVRARAAKPIVTDATIDVDPKPFLEHARRSDAAEKANLKVRDSQLKLEASQQKATATEAKHGRESIEYRRAALNVEKTTRSLSDAQDQLDRTVKKVAGTMASDAQRATEGYSRKIEQAADETAEAGERIESGFIGRIKGMAAPLLAAGAAAGAALTKGIFDAIDVEAATDKLAGQLHLSEVESEKAGRAAGRIYADVYGESLEEVNDAIRSLSANLDVAVDGADLEPLAKKLLNLTSTFGAESDELTRAISSLVKNGLAKNVDEAFDLITAGFQSGMDRGGEFLDTLNEYASPLRALGISMDDFIGITEAGLDAGVYSVDKLGDALKEFSIRAIDGSESTADAFSALGLSADDYAARIAEGGPSARKATTEIIDALLGVKDKVKQDAAGVGLFGSMWEDLKAKGIGALKPIGSGIGDVAGRADELNDTLGSNNATVIEGFKRRFSQAMTSAGAAAIELGGKIREKVSGALEGVDFKGAADDVIGWFRDVYTENADAIGDVGDTFSQLAGIARRAFGDVKDAINDVFGSSSGTGRDVRKIISVLLDLGSAALDLWKDITKRALPGIVDAFKGVLHGIRGVVKIITGILTLDFAKVWAGLKDIAAGALEALGGAIRSGTAPVRELASKMGRAVSSPLTSIWGGIKKAWRSGLDVILGGVSTASGAIASMLDAAGKLPVVGGKFKGLADDVRKGQKAIDEYRESLRKANKEQERTEGIKKMRGEVRDLRERLKGLKRGTDDYRETSEKLRKKQRDLNRALRDGDDAGRKGAKGVKEIGKAGGNAATAVYNAADNISSNLIAVSKGLGIKPPSFNVKVPRGQGVSGGGSSSEADAAFVKGHAVGGIPNPGSGAADDHMLVDRTGRPVAMMSGTEGILNTPQMHEVDHALQVAAMLGESRFSGLNELWSSGMRHYAAGGPLGAIPRFAAGGGIVPVPGFPGEHAAASVIPQILSTSRRFDLTLTDAYGPGHKSPGHTVTGTAADFAGPDPNMDRAVRYLVGRGYLVGYDGRYGSADWPGHGPAAGQGGGNAHLHVEFGGKGKGVTGGGGSRISVGNIETPQITGPKGALLSIARGAAGKVAKDANTWLDRKAAALSVPVAGGGGAGGGKTSAGGAYNKARLKALWKRHNSNGDPNLMAAIALAESSGNPRSIGIPTSGGRAHGLWQIMWPAHRASFPGRNPLNVDDNAIMAGSILRSQGLGAWEAYTRGMHTKFLNRGGALANLPRFSKGGARKKPSFREATLADAGLGGSAFRSLRAKQSDRVGSFDRLSELLETDSKRYGLTERRNDLTDEVLIDEETGEVNTGAVKQRAAEIQALADIKQRMAKRLRSARRIAKRVQKTYSTIITRLKKALKAATSGKKGKTSKARKAAAASYREQIADYLGRRKEWRGKETDLNWDIEDSDIDLESLLGERKGVLGTTAESRDDDNDNGGDDDNDNGGGDNDNGGGDGPTEVQLPPTAEDIARGVAEQFNAFNASRAELFGSFGGNFIRNTLPQSFGGNQDDAGARYFGGGQSGADGVVAAAGGQGGPTEGATITQNMYFNGPQPPDPHALTAAALHELQVRV